MRTYRIVHSAVACAALSSMLASAANITQNSPTPTTGIPYRWAVDLTGTDTAIFSRHVGAWSWEDDSLFNPGLGEPPVGWTHESDWVAVTLAQASTFTLRLERDTNVPWPGAGEPDRLASIASMFPSFTIWDGQDNDDAQVHKYNNRGSVSWAEELSFLDFLDNSTLTAIEETWELPAGEYTIVVGSNSPATDTDRQGYRATLTTVPIPEPGIVALLLGVVPALGWRRRRKVGKGSAIDSRQANFT